MGSKSKKTTLQWQESAICLPVGLNEIEATLWNWDYFQRLGQDFVRGRQRFSLSSLHVAWGLNTVLPGWLFSGKWRTIFSNCVSYYKGKTPGYKMSSVFSDIQIIHFGVLLRKIITQSKCTCRVVFCVTLKKQRAHLFNTGRRNVFRLGFPRSGG